MTFLQRNPIPTDGVSIPDDVHGEFWAKCQGSRHRAGFHGFMSVYPMIGGPDPVMAISVQDCEITITKAQAMAFFGLVEAPEPVPMPPIGELMYFPV